jgi:hypothetical protein
MTYPVPGWILLFPNQMSHRASQPCMQRKGLGQWVLVYPYSNKPQPTPHMIPMGWDGRCSRFTESVTSFNVVYTDHAKNSHRSFSYLQWRHQQSERQRTSILRTAIAFNKHMHAKLQEAMIVSICECPPWFDSYFRGWHAGTPGKPIWNVRSQCLGASHGWVGRNCFWMASECFREAIGTHQTSV